MMELLEEDWKTFSSDPEGQRKTCLCAMTFVCGFFGALRGEEIVRLELGAIRKYWEEAVSFPDAPHVPMMLSGRFKRETGEKLFCQPLAPTSKSGINIKEWFSGRYG